MRILVAPNAFKNSLSATDAAEAIIQGLKQSTLHFQHECFPIGDGGNGTADLIIKRKKGRWVSAQVHDPFGRKINASIGLLDEEKTAVIEMAEASGLQRLGPGELDPLRASSFGTGELIRFALDKAVHKIILGMGGSATVDGGAGILRALGIRFLNANGEALPDRPENMSDLSEIDLSGMDKRMLDCDLTILCDVNNPLLGKDGSAWVFGPQKGATKKGVKKLDASLSKFKEITLHLKGKDMSSVVYGGAAGGAAAGLFAFLDAKLVNGIDYFLKMTGFDEALAKTDLVITGEGSIDEQTLQGKGPYGVAFRAKKKGLPVIALAGKVPLKENWKFSKYFDVLLAIGNEPVDLPTAMRVTADNLTRTSTVLGNLLAIS